MSCYKKVPDGFSFSTEFDTYILAYCSDDCTWFATNKRFFYFEYDKEFKTEEDAVAYFENNLKEFYDIELKICNYRPDFMKNKIYLNSTIDEYILGVPNKEEKEIVFDLSEKENTNDKSK